MTDVINFQGAHVRRFDLKRVSAVDACRALGYQEPRKAWFNLKSRNDELTEFSVVAKLKTTADGKEYDSDTLDIQGVLVLCMLSRTQKATEFRKWAAEQLKPIIERKGGEISLELVEQLAKGALLQADEIRRLQAQLDSQADEVALAQAIVASDGALTLTSMAQLLNTTERGCGLKRLCYFLRQKSILHYDREGNLIPYQTFLDRGYFELVESTYQRGEVTKNALSCRVLPAGQTFVAGLWKKDELPFLDQDLQTAILAEHKKSLIQFIE